MDEKEFSSINVIPLVDVTLVLLTIVLVTSTFIATGLIPVDLPRASRTDEAPMKTQMVEIDSAGSLFFNGRPVDEAALRGGMEQVDRGMPVLIRADRELHLQRFVDVLDLVKTLGFTRVSLQAEGHPAR